METATGPMEGLKAINHKGPFAVVVADLKMPKMDGIQFLGRVKELFPESVRIMWAIIIIVGTGLFLQNRC